MKTRLFALVLVFLCAFPAVLQAAKAPKLEALLAEYKKARFDVLNKLNGIYAEQADELIKVYRQATDLTGIERAEEFAKGLRNPEVKNDWVGRNADVQSGDPLTLLQAAYGQARAENLGMVYMFYASTAENLRRQLLESKDQAGAQLMGTFLQKIKSTAPKIAPAKPAAATVTAAAKPAGSAGGRTTTAAMTKVHKAPAAAAPAHAPETNAAPVAAGPTVILEPPLPN